MQAPDKFSMQHPGCVVILIDQSDSMSEVMQLGPAKKEECAKAVNTILWELLLTCADGDDDYRDRIAVGLLGYSGEAGVRSAWEGRLEGQKLLSVSEYADLYLKIEPVKVQRKTETAGVMREVVENRPVWVRVYAGGSTPMAAALEMAARWIQDWSKRHPDSLPPVVINITDGAPDGDDWDDTRAAAKAVRAVRTKWGQAVLMNCHLCASDGGSVSLPADPSRLPDTKEAKLLFELASELPAWMIEAARKKNLAPSSGARALVYNAPATFLVNLLRICTTERARG